MCYVRGCPDPNSHISNYHLCKKCKEFGHGFLECGKSFHYMPELFNYKCTIPCCILRTTHSTKGHRCSFCKEQHSEKKCKLQYDFKIKCFCSEINKIRIIHSLTRGFGLCLECNTIESLVLLPDCKHYLCSYCLEKKCNIFTENCIADFNGFQNTYKIEYAGLGCGYFIRNLNGICQKFFLHSDAQGQYGTNDIPKSELFISGLTSLRHISNKIKTNFPFLNPNLSSLIHSFIFEQSDFLQIHAFQD